MPCKDMYIRTQIPYRDVSLRPFHNESPFYTTITKRPQVKEPTAAGAMRDAAALVVAVAVAVAEAVAVAVWLSAEGKIVRTHDAEFLM